MGSTQTGIRVVRSLPTCLSLLYSTLILYSITMFYYSILLLYYSTTTVVVAIRCSSAFRLPLGEHRRLVFRLLLDYVEDIYYVVGDPFCPLVLVIRPQNTHVCVYIPLPLVVLSLNSPALTNVR